MALSNHDRRRLKTDFPLYAKHCLKIKTKSGQVRPLILNKAQMRAHAQAQQQIKDTGKVRQIVLKGRQMGLSTYIEARLFWLTTHRVGTNTFILTHEQAATNNLFDMVERYYDNLPVPLKPTTDRANAKEIKFGRLMSGYKVGTAGGRAVGRSSTIQLFHGSETAFWPHALEHNAGIMQAIPTGDSARGTEVWQESTANGIGDLFHGLWEDATAGKSEFQALFAPWFWDETYTLPVDDEFEMTDEEFDYAELHDLYDGQIMWRRLKLAELRDEYLFKQEYPATPEEAFEAAGDRVLIPVHMAQRAAKTVAEAYGPIVIGVDPARFGDDRTGIVVRQGRRVIDCRKIDHMDTMAVVGETMELCRVYEPNRVFVDVIGLGAGVVDRLRELNVPVVAVAGSESPNESSRYFNKRAEMWGNMKDWLDGEIPVSIPDDPELIADITSLHYEFRVRGGHSTYKLESKDDAKKRGIRSPDLGDALAMTFAQNLTAVIESFEPEAA